MNWGRRSARQRPDEAPTALAESHPTRHPRAEPLPHQADPDAGVVEDTRPFFLPRRGGRHADWIDPASEIPESPVPAGSVPGSVAGSPLTERIHRWRRQLLPLPEEAVDQHLGSGEQVLHLVHPSRRSFLVTKLWLFALLGADVALVLWALSRSNEIVASVLWLAAVVLIAVLLFRRLADRYTSYVITNARMMRMSGIVGRSVESIPWIRVTDVHFKQTNLHRLLGYATLHIESANESMGLRELTGVPDPLRFNRYLMDMVVAKQGPSVPLGRRSDYAILPPRKGLFGKRQRAHVLLERSAVEAEAEQGRSPRPAAGEPGPAAEGPGGGRRVRPVTSDRGGTVAPDPAVGDLSDLARTAEQELAADRRRQAYYYEPYEGDDRPPGD